MDRAGEVRYAPRCGGSFERRVGFVGENPAEAGLAHCRGYDTRGAGAVHRFSICHRRDHTRRGGGDVEEVSGWKGRENSGGFEEPGGSCE